VLSVGAELLTLAVFAAAAFRVRRSPSRW
jgi:hypothetical protein